MGLDVGDSRIGTALSDPLGMLASPASIISRTEEEKDVLAVLDIVRDKKVERIIVGLPYNMDGSLGSQARKVKKFVEVLRGHTDVPIEFRDERLSTWDARERLRSTKKTSDKIRYDAAAAALILQGYLDEAAR
jgi:putative Holliday junction resolvase